MHQAVDRNKGRKSVEALQTRYLKDYDQPYQGGELRPHFIYEQFKIKGSALIAWQAGADVTTEAMVDLEDQLNQGFIRAKKMIHFLGEFYFCRLKEAVYLQRLFLSLWESELVRLTGLPISRVGDDLYFKDQKISVSIVAPSTVSQLFHCALNLDPAGAPVPAIGLEALFKLAPHRLAETLSFDSQKLSEKIMYRFEDEVRRAQEACTKVRPVV